jgi:hypothetical protein
MARRNWRAGICNTFWSGQVEEERREKYDKAKWL